MPVIDGIARLNSKLLRLAYLGKTFLLAAH
jgi:hypothetical protein